jgi:type I restriction enzyme S subunit
MSWATVKMGSFLKNRDLRFKPKNIEISGLRRIDKIDFSGKIYISDKQSNTDMILVKRGDLVISGINVEKGAMAIYQGDEDITATIHYSSYEYDTNIIDEEFLKCFLKSKNFIQAIKEQVPAGIKTEIKPKHILPLEVKIPANIEEQKKIVEKFKKNALYLESIETETNNQLDLLKNLRQQILQDAIQGKLVPQNPNDEPASKLLERIKAEKERLIKEKKIKKEKPLPPIKPEEIPFEIPDSWVWCRLGEIGTINPRNHLNDEIDVSFIPMTMISEKYGKQPEFVIRKWKEIKSGFTHFAKNDVAVAKITPCFENSKACVFKNLINDNGAGTTELHVFRGIPEYYDPEYIYMNLKTKHFLVNGERIMRGVAGQQRVPTEYFSNYLIPLPPLSEQNRIVEKIECTIQFCDELEQTIQQNQNYTQELLQVALKEALEPKDN